VPGFEADGGNEELDDLDTDSEYLSQYSNKDRAYG